MWFLNWRWKMKRARMRRESAKHRKRREEAQPLRLRLIAKTGHCMICNHSPRRPWRDKPIGKSSLCCHEIASGSNRQRALDKPYAILVLCFHCNQHVVEDWARSRQLALLRLRSPEDYDLEAYNLLVRTDQYSSGSMISEGDVDFHGGPTGYFE